MKNPPIFIIFLLFFVFSGCTKSINTPRYYVLEFDAAQPEITKPVVKDLCELLPVRISEVYAQHRIALRKRSHEINYYHYHKWAESPDINIERLIQKGLNRHRLFSNIAVDIWNATPGYQLNSTVHYLEVVEGEDDLIAHLSMSFEIFSRHNNEVVVTHFFDEHKVLEEWDLNMMSLEMSAILKEELDAFAMKIRDYLTNL
jgi:ABC-type uncharacterized transport system auxiliary subunit